MPFLRRRLSPLADRKLLGSAYESVAQEVGGPFRDQTVRRFFCLSCFL